TPPAGDWYALGHVAYALAPSLTQGRNRADSDWHEPAWESAVTAAPTGWPLCRAACAIPPGLCGHASIFPDKAWPFSTSLAWGRAHAPCLLHSARFFAKAPVVAVFRH